MIRKENNGIRWLEFSLLADFPHLKHGVLLRHGGVSKPPFDSLNMSFYGDESHIVAANHRLACQALGIPGFVWRKQVHGSHVLHVNACNHHEADGISTDHPDTPLLIMHADCQAALFYDPIHQAIANVHAGWRGSAANIYRHAVEWMKKRYGSHPADLLVCISPSLGPHQAEFLNYQTELPEAFTQFRVKECHFDFWEISRWQLMNCGILPAHIEIAGICTKESPLDFFSYRRDKGLARNGTFIMLSRS